KTMTRKRSRMVLTSGGLEPVLDAGGGNHSVFAKALLDVLKANSEIPRRGTLSSRGGCTGCLCGWPASGRTSARVRAD
ncbi:MAG TPA: hypothetical protein VHH94_03455, partial [Gammaproteobacteria bacterium]|nr:hypothetical protein [Gammaproteobacteria bacterium]